MRKLSKPLSILLSFIMIVSLFTIVPFTAAAEEADAITSWSELQERINNAVNGDTITLDADLTAGNEDTFLSFSGKTLTLDLTVTHSTATLPSQRKVALLSTSDPAR